ncbi:MAG TPA: fatty acid--CoA ligase family protein, partial [Ktedonobacteraceae bacterium]|nr:fatty acid--CoA ligase family protein [Ktedonobacteraceae bacterium]
AGIHLILNDTFSPFSFWNTLQQECVNICSVVPEILRVLCRRPAHQKRFPHLRYLVSAAAPLSAEISKQFYEKTAIPIHQGYGLSESTNFATTLPYDIPLEEYFSVMHSQPQPSIGTSLYGSTVVIINQRGEKIEAGITGEIVIQGHSNMLGYWRDEEATQQALGDGFLHTGDLGFYVSYGKRDYFFITGRIKEIILRCGQNISPLEIERELLFLQKMGDFAIVGFQHDQVGEEVGLYISTNVPNLISPHSFDPLTEMPFFKRPKVVVIESKPIPRTSTGKIRRGSLRNFFNECHDWRFGNGQVVLIRTGEKDDRNS